MMSLKFWVRLGRRFWQDGGPSKNNKNIDNRLFSLIIQLYYGSFER
jgi:hypothetical protein